MSDSMVMHQQKFGKCNVLILDPYAVGLVIFIQPSFDNELNPDEDPLGICDYVAADYSEALKFCTDTVGPLKILVGPEDFDCAFGYDIYLFEIEREFVLA